MLCVVESNSLIPGPKMLDMVGLLCFVSRVVWSTLDCLIVLKHKTRIAETKTEKKQIENEGRNKTRHNQKPVRARWPGKVPESGLH